MAFSLRTVCATLCTIVGCGYASTTLAGGVSELTQPAWAQLSPQQQQALAPLAAKWDDMAAYRRKKWLVIAEQYETLPPPAQARMQLRMREWAALTPQERVQAREKYKSLQNISPEMRAALLQNWQEYQALPEADKQQLKDITVSRPPVDGIPPATASGPLHQAETQPVKPVTPGTVKSGANPEKK